MLPSRLPLLALLSCLAAIAQTRVLNVGMLFAQNNSRLSYFVGWKKNAAAPAVAWQRIQREGLMPDISSVNFTWAIDECIPSTTSRAMLDFIGSGVDVVLGPTCSDSAVMGALISPIYDFPIFLWGPQYGSDLDNVTKFPTTITVGFSGQPQALATLALLRKYNWSEVAEIYTTERDPAVARCSRVIGEFDTLAQPLVDQNIVCRRHITNSTMDEFRSTLRDARDNARVMVVCLESLLSRRMLLLAAAELGMNTSEYVYICLESQRTGLRTYGPNGTIDYMWIDKRVPPDGRDAEALTTARRSIVLDHERSDNDTSTSFLAQVADAFELAPFNCTDCNQLDTSISRVAELHDPFYLYAMARNKTVQLHPEMARNMSARELLRNAKGQFDGQSGRVSINANGGRDPIFTVTLLGLGDVPFDVLRIECKTVGYSMTQNFHELYSSESAMWTTRGGVRPLTMPPCGCKNELCPISLANQYLTVFAAAISALVVVIAIVGVLTYRWKVRQEEAQDLQWQISFAALSRPAGASPMETPKERRHSTTASVVSDESQHTLDGRKGSERHEYFFYRNQAVVGRKHIGYRAVAKEDVLEIRQLRSLEHDNVNRLVGICSNGPVFMTIWRFCERGSLHDVLQKSTMQMDWFFKFSLIRDIAGGLNYLHHSVCGAHGWLSSTTCLVDSRWQLKISYAGYHSIKAVDTRTPQCLLFTAPELIRSGDRVGTKPGDIYSFAIICSKIATRKPVWSQELSEMDVEDLIFEIKKGGKEPMRPSFAMEQHDFHPSMMMLVNDCWDENPERRPTAEIVQKAINSLEHGKSQNLMDHVFKVLEQYASNLEDEVEARTKELSNEKKKSDIILYKMLPKQVADRLKLGQTIEPETFDCVTIFFSGVVSFTTLAARCTPLQVVNLLNHLYTIFDAIIEERDAYKVETIGDGYLCVSGLPHRNGNEHAREIAEMSFALLKAIDTFRVPHMPKERIQIRVGLHTGSCVAGVVGMTMPRYCLFGDTVNIAARMESNGKPGAIHISTATNSFLSRVIGGYRTELRGDVIVKGQGSIETYWLLGKEDDSP